MTRPQRQLHQQNNAAQLTRFFVTLVCACMLILVPAGENPAHAQRASQTSTPVPLPSLTGQCFAQPLSHVFVPMTGGHFSVKLPKNKILLMQLPAGMTISDVAHQAGWDFRNLNNTLIVIPDANLAEGHSTNIVLDFRLRGRE